MDIWFILFVNARAQGRREGLEEAAKIAEEVRRDQRALYKRMRAEGKPKLAHVAYRAYMTALVIWQVIANRSRLTQKDSE